MVDTIDLLRYQSLTAAINNIQPSQSFLKQLLFSTERTLATETMEISTKIGKRKMAPFVRKGGEGIMIPGTSAEFATVEGPNIRVKMPFTPSELLWKRRPGVPIYASENEIDAAAKQHIADDLEYMSKQIENSEEWLCSQALLGTITYSRAEQEIFRITYPRDATLTWDVSGSAPWSTAASKASIQFKEVKRRMNAVDGFTPTIALMPQDVADYFLALDEIRGSNSLLSNDRNLTAGEISLVEQYTQQGALYLGRFCGIACWEYSRTIEGDDGSTVSLLPAKKVQFVAQTPNNEFKTFYAAIPDASAPNGLVTRTKRFAKSWVTEDPSVIWALSHTRPLPVPTRTNATMTLVVLP